MKVIRPRLFALKLYIAYLGNIGRRVPALQGGEAEVVEGGARYVQGVVAVHPVPVLLQVHHTVGGFSGRLRFRDLVSDGGQVCGDYAREVVEQFVVGDHRLALHPAHVVLQLLVQDFRALVGRGGDHDVGDHGVEALVGGLAVAAHMRPVVVRLVTVHKRNDVED